ncbi:MAG: DUF2905 domain-containing protein [Acidobacteriota bacterium]
MLTEIGKVLIFFGLLLVVFGLLLTFLPSFSSSRIGRLPGDIHIQKENWSLYVPITTCIVLSVILSLLLWIIFLLRR